MIHFSTTIDCLAPTDCIVFVGNTRNFSWLWRESQRSRPCHATWARVLGLAWQEGRWGRLACTPQCLPSHLLCTGSTSQAGLWLPDCHCPNPIKTSTLSFSPLLYFVYHSSCPLKIFWWPGIDLGYYVVHLSRVLYFVQWLITLGQVDGVWWYTVTRRPRQGWGVLTPGS